MSAAVCASRAMSGFTHHISPSSSVVVIGAIRWLISSWVAMPVARLPVRSRMILSRIKGSVCGLGLGFLLILVCLRVSLGVALFVPFPRTSGDAPLSFLIGRGALFICRAML